MPDHHDTVLKSKLLRAIRAAMSGRNAIIAVKNLAELNSCEEILQLWKRDRYIVDTGGWSKLMLRQYDSLRGLDLGTHLHDMTTGTWMFTYRQKYTSIHIMTAGVVTNNTVLIA